jgi:geranylgeranyl pyrophosphate synthase
MGLEKARSEAEGLIEAAEQELAAFGPKGNTLRELARFVVERKN